LINQSNKFMFNIDLQHLQVLRAIEKEGSMTKASQALRLSQSALSHHLRELEKNIGTPLFDRRNKKLWLTEAGKEMLRSADVIIRELEKLQANIQELKSGDSGKIRISTQCYTAYYWLPQLLNKFSKIYPKIEIQIVAEATRRPLQYLTDEKIDIAIVNTKACQKYEFEKTLEPEVLFNDELVVVLNKNNSLAGRSVVSPQDLENQILLTYDADDKDLDLINMVLKPKRIKPANIIKMALTEVIVEMIKCDMGIAVMARWLVQPMLTGAIKIIPFGDPFAQRTWHGVTRGNRTAIQKKFIDFAIHELRKRSETYLLSFEVT